MAGIGTHTSRIVAIFTFNPKERKRQGYLQMNHITAASEKAHEAIDALKESVLTVLAEGGKRIPAEYVRDKLRLKEMVAKTNTGKSFGSTQIINAVLWLLENDNCVVKHGEKRNSRWEVTGKGLARLGRTE